MGDWVGGWGRGHKGDEGWGGGTMKDWGRGRTEKNEELGTG